MKLKVHVVVSDAAENINVTLQHTGVHYPTHTIVHEVEIEIPDLPKRFALDRITFAKDTTHD